MTQKHTPAPWHIKVLDDIFIEPRVCKIPANGCYDYNVWKANARLIAAAPNMKDALIISNAAENGDIKILNKYGWNEYSNFTAEEFARNARYAAIAKATGEA